MLIDRGACGNAGCPKSRMRTASKLNMATAMRKSTGLDLFLGVGMRGQADSVAR